MRFPAQNEYPKFVYVASQRYSVHFVKDLKFFGDCHPDKYRIRIKTGMSKRETFSTFLHELLHAISFEYDFKLKHRSLNVIETAIVNLILDNFT